MLYMVTCTINIPPMLAYIPSMDPMGKTIINPSHTKAQGEVAARLLLSDALMAGGKLQEALNEWCEDSSF